MKSRFFNSLSLEFSFSSIVLPDSGVLLDFTVASSEMFDWFFFVLAILLVRYILIAGLFFVLFYVLLTKRIKPKKIQLSFPQLNDYGREVSYSILTTCIFACVGLLVFREEFLGPYTQIYRELNQFGVGYYVLSFVLMLLIHDTYFYWFHRLMHTKFGMKYIHITHHRSTNPSPWAAFAFSPAEAVIEAGIIVVFAFLFPVHPLTIMMFMIFMTVYNVYGHLGWELYPKGFHKSIIGRWINTSVNHNLHHEKFEGNYGLYFLFWDRWMGTIRDDYDASYEAISIRK